MEAFEKRCANYICDANEAVQFKLSKYPKYCIKTGFLLLCQSHMPQ